MPIFHEDPENDSPCVVVRQSYRRLDLGLLHFGPVNLYHSRAILEEDVGRLIEEEYSIRRFDATRWEMIATFFADFARTMGFADGYGRNLNALEACLGEIIIPDAGGIVIVFDAYDKFAKAHEMVAQELLDIIAGSSRLRQVFGKTLIALVQSDDPRIRFEPVGATRVYWNQREFLDSSRGS